METYLVCIFGNRFRLASVVENLLTSSLIDKASGWFMTELVDSSLRIVQLFQTDRFKWSFRYNRLMIGFELMIYDYWLICLRPSFLLTFRSSRPYLPTPDLFPIFSFLFTAYYQLFTCHYSLFTLHYSLFTNHFSLFTFFQTVLLRWNLLVQQLQFRRRWLPFEFHRSTQPLQMIDA